MTSTNNHQEPNNAVNTTNITQKNKPLISNEDRHRIVAKTLEALPPITISSMLGINYKTVYHITKKYLQTGIIIPQTKGGDRSSKLSLELKEQIIAKVDEECTITLRQLVEWVCSNFNNNVSMGTIDRNLKAFHYTLKQATIIPERRNCSVTIEIRYEYALAFRLLEETIDDKNVIFLDEVGFSVVTRPSRGRSLRGNSAYITVSAARSRNISVVAAMNKYEMIFHKNSREGSKWRRFLNSLERNKNKMCL